MNVTALFVSLLMSSAVTSTHNDTRSKRDVVVGTQSNQAAKLPNLVFSLSAALKSASHRIHCFSSALCLNNNPSKIHIFPHE